jgi:DNA-binding MarR family transcriptional regulator
MSIAKRGSSFEGAQLPLLGGLLRLCYQELVNELGRQLAAAGMDDVRPAQYAVCQQLAANRQGLRLTELAAYAGITKPSMSALVDGLERASYVERVADARDQRAQLVRFTARGRSFARTAFRATARFEQTWARRVGVRELETLRRILRALVDSRPRAGEP